MNLWSTGIIPGLSYLKGYYGTTMHGVWYPPILILLNIDKNIEQVRVRQRQWQVEDDNTFERNGRSPRRQ